MHFWFTNLLASYIFTRMTNPRGNTDQFSRGRKGVKIYFVVYMSTGYAIG